MNTQTINIRAQILATIGCAALLVMVLICAASVNAKSKAPAPETSKLTSALIAATTGKSYATVSIYLTANSFLSNLPAKTSDLTLPDQGTSAAKRSAQLNPKKLNDAEKVAASIAENSRNAALPLIRNAAKSDLAASDRVQRKVKRLGGSVVSANPLPNQITARVPVDAISALAGLTAVLKITRAPKTPTEMSSPIDGSAIWRANGFTGQGPSLDTYGGPDFVNFDVGVRANHTAFKTRLPGDCSTCAGSGPSRVITSVKRTDLNGDKHGNTIAAAVAATDLTSTGRTGMAYGIDKLYDNFQATNPYLWDLGITTNNDTALGGNPDLPEVVNYSAGVYADTTDLMPGTELWDAMESSLGILNTIAAGNCGIDDPFYSCGGTPHRIAYPASNYNVLTMGGLDTTTVFPDISGFKPWDHTSPGPTWGGRKKPDLIAYPGGLSGTPSAIDDNAYTSFGMGTSFSAPQGAAGALLLSSTSVYKPTAQKAIMINTATPVQGQTYWSPRTGWGALNLDGAFYQRGNYVNGDVSGSGANGVRFYKMTGVASGDRATLVWNRRSNLDNISNPSNGQILGPTYYNLTNLDLSQFDPGTLAGTSTGGSDAADTVDTDQTITAANPMPGNGTDGGDNIEQIRSTGTGTQILKVKSMSPVAGATAEPFSLASAKAPVALETPVPEVSLDVTPTDIGGDVQAQVTATVENTSSDVDLENVSVELSLPGGVILPSGSTTSTPVPLPAGDTTTATWIVRGTYSGTKSLSATANGSAYGEPFTGTDTTTLDVDGSPPTVNVVAMQAWSTTASPAFQWSGNDSQSAVDHFDVESSIDGNPFIPISTSPLQSSLVFPAAEGQKIALRIRATDLFGNTSDWTEVSTTIDAIPPVAALGTIDASKRGIRRVPLYFSNVGSPVTAKFTFSSKNGGRTGSAINGESIAYTNNSSAIDIVSVGLVVTDALGRAATAQQSLTIEPRIGPSGLKYKSVKKRGRTVTIRGTIFKKFSGKVTVTARRIGPKGTKRRVKKATAKKGNFKFALKLKPGRYKFVTSTPKTSRYSATSITSKLTLK